MLRLTLICAITSICVLLTQIHLSKGKSANTVIRSEYKSIEPKETTDVIKQRGQLMYPYNAVDLLSISSSKPLHDQPLPFKLPFFGFEFAYAYIHRDGYITFNKGLLSYDFPLKFPLNPVNPIVEEDPSLIAPFFAVQDIPPSREVPLSGVYLRIVDIEKENNITLRDTILLDFREAMIGSSSFTPKYALIVTWRNMTYANRRPETKLKTNTYQAVIATDESRTYAMFNYENIEWVTHLDNYDGLKGPAAFIGFNAGNTTRSFEYAPYSQSHRLSLINTNKYNGRHYGRHIFQIDEQIWPGVCINKDIDPNLPDLMPLTFFPKQGNMLGGTLVDITGPCLKPDDVIICTFGELKVKGFYKSARHATCISPQVMYHGYIDLTVSVNDRTSFLGRFYIQPPDIGEPDVVIQDGNETLEEPEKLTLKWSAEKLYTKNLSNTIDISLYGYRESNDTNPQLTFIRYLVSGVPLEAFSYDLDAAKLRDNDDPGMQDIVFGYISVTLTNPKILGDGMTLSPILWSRSMPLAWYFKKQWEKQYGANGQWKQEFCYRWHYNKERSEIFFYAREDDTTQCPCTADQALQDKGRFLPDSQCNLVTRNCETFHKGAQRCFNTGRASNLASGQTCCYDDYGELIQTSDTMYGGTPSRSSVYGKYPFKMRKMIPTISNWLYDKMPFFFCCKWQAKEDNAGACQIYKFWRASQDCSDYKIPAVGVVFGDPHFITFDGTNYTFNGHGEFVLVHANNSVNKLDIQARFEQVPRTKYSQSEIRATHLTAIAAKEKHSAVVEFRVRPEAARSRYHMYLIVDKEYVFFGNESVRMQNFRGVTLYQPEGIKNMSHIIAMFDSGAGIEIITTDGHMTAHILLPETFQNQVDGVLGYYSNQKDDDFRTPKTEAKARKVMKPTSLATEQIHNDFGMLWRVQEVFEEGVGSSLFWHNSKPFAQYDNKSFIPEFRLPPNDLVLPENRKLLKREIEITCGESVACRYDYILTLDKNFATVTKMHEAWGYSAQSFRNVSTIRCPALATPINGRKSENRYFPGAVITFNCDPGYILIGYESRLCRSDGIWSAGPEAKCIKQILP